MQPLKERSTPTSPIEAHGIELLREARGFSPAPGAKQRVRARLVGRGLGRRTSTFRPRLLAVGIVCVAGTSLALSGGLLTRRYQNWFEPASVGMPMSGRSNTALPPDARNAHPATNANPASATDAANTDAANKDAAGRAPSILPGATLTPPAAEASSDASTTPSSGAAAGSLPTSLASPKQASSAPGASKLPEASAKRTDASPEAAPSDETHLVFDAMRALRQEGRPDRASRLLDEYMSRFPAGPLSEEAMALSIEAKARTGDPRAKDLATSYLARFPSGQFRTQAERVQARFAP